LGSTWTQNTVRAGTDRLSGFENLIGSQFNDTLTGSAGSNLLIGLGGNDRLDGGSGADWMAGGLGSDTYVVDNAGDVVDETGGDGVDTVLTSVSFSLSDTAHAIGAIENVTLTGKAGIYAVGNDLDNVLIGNAASNMLIGGAGADRLDGGAGADLMHGGSGNDTYVVDHAGDVVNESDGDGYDTVMSSISFSLADGVHAVGAIENLMLTGSKAINATGSGLDNVLMGNGAANVLIGAGGADWLDGGGGVDTASYVSSASGVSVSLALGTGLGGDAEGDRLFNIENLTGSSYNDTLEGNAGNNVLAGGAGVDTVSYANATAGVTVSLAQTKAQATGGAGTDTLSGLENLIGSQFNDTLTGTSGSNLLIGLGGNDRLTGAGGNDTFLFLPGFGKDTITDFAAGPNSIAHDLIAFDHSIFADFDAVMAMTSQVGANTVITVDVENAVTLLNVQMSNLHRDDFSFV
jgi:Ca2+-binding RTX toxin-like protein